MLDKLGLWLNGFSGDLGGFKQKKWHLGCVIALLTHRASYGFFQRDVKTKNTGHHLALLISTCIPLTKGKK